MREKGAGTHDKVEEERAAEREDELCESGGQRCPSRLFALPERRVTHLPDGFCAVSLAQLRDDDEADDGEGDVPRGCVGEGGESGEDDVALEEVGEVEVGHSALLRGKSEGSGREVGEGRRSEKARDSAGAAAMVSG